MILSFHQAQINLEILQFKNKLSFYKIKSMSYSRKKHSHPHNFLDYISENNYIITHECQPSINRYQIHAHKRKSSQISSFSYKSKNKKISSIDQLNNSLNKFQPHFPLSIRNKAVKSSKTSKKSLNKKQFSSEKNKNPYKNINSLTNRNQNHKISIDRKEKVKVVDNLTQNYTNSEKIKPNIKNNIKGDKNSEKTLPHKNENKEDNTNSERKKKESQKTIICKMRLRQKKLQLIVSRCSKVINEYYERITLLKKQNQSLIAENTKLKNCQFQMIKNGTIY